VDSAVELALRERIMAWVADRATRNGGWLGREELLTGYRPDGGEPLALIDYSRGIRNPTSFAATLSVVSSVGGPYEDRDSGDGLLHYSYRRGGTEGDNRKLRRALDLGVPLLMFVKPEPGIYVPVQPVYVVADDEASGTFVIALDEAFRYLPDPAHLTGDQRRYALRLARQRLHQPVFRGQVIRAYATRCTICTLGHGELLEAAHIYPDSHPEGRAVTSNGLSLCRIHHTAYDRNLLGITPDHRVHVDADLLAEVDGPMLRHGLQEMHGRTLVLPTRTADRPDRDALAWRYEQFRAG
jgi:putative restriction endonuclease